MMTEERKSAFASINKEKTPPAAAPETNENMAVSQEEASGITAPPDWDLMPPRATIRRGNSR
jgi:hypothetical protein